MSTEKTIFALSYINDVRNYTTTSVSENIETLKKDVKETWENDCNDAWPDQNMTEEPEYHQNIDGSCCYYYVDPTDNIRKLYAQIEIVNVM